MRVGLLALLALIMADVQGQSPSFEDFRQAFVAGDVQQIDALLQASRNRPPVDENGVTVLHKAIHIYSSNRIAIVERLIAARMDVNARAKDGRTPLHWAANFDCANCAELLLKAGAQVAARDEDGDTPLHGASRDVIPLLLKAGADPLAKNAAGNVPLHHLSHDALLVAGVNVRNPAGLTPLHYAALDGNEGAIEWLLSKGADPQAKTTATTHYRASFMSKAFGPGDEVPAGSRPLDLAKMQHSHSKWSTGAHRKSVDALEKVTKRKGWFSR